MLAALHVVEQETLWACVSAQQTSPLGHGDVGQSIDVPPLLDPLELPLLDPLEPPLPELLALPLELPLPELLAVPLLEPLELPLLDPLELPLPDPEPLPDPPSAPVPLPSDDEAPPQPVQDERATRAAVPPETRSRRDMGTSKAEPHCIRRRALEPAPKTSVRAAASGTPRRTARRANTRSTTRPRGGRASASR